MDVDALWERSDTGRRRSASRLTRDRIVEAAVGLADAEGISAVSMSRLADRLDTAPMSLYRHVAGKEALIAYMLDAAAGDSPASNPDAVWRQTIERWAHALRELIQMHPWVLDLPLARMPIGPQRAAWLDRGLAAFAGTNLAEHEKAALILLVNDYVFSHARLAAHRATGDAMPPLIPLELDRARFPSLRAALDAGIFGPTDDESDFRFGLDRILDGIEVLVGSKDAKAPRARGSRERESG